MPALKRVVNNIVRKFGYEIRKVKPAPPAAAAKAAPAKPSAPVPKPKKKKVPKNMWSWLKENQSIQTVIDIGANDGEFARFLVRFFKPDKVYAFEPIQDCIPLIEKNLSHVSNLEIHNVALSDHGGKKQIFQNSYLPASSLLNITQLQVDEFPKTSGVEPKDVDVVTLDEVLDPGQLEKGVFIKMDVQGMEDLVIKGGQKVFSAACCVLVEMSFVHMYENQPLFEEVHDLLTDLGFRFSGIKNQIDSESTGRPLFAHCFYIKS